MNVSQFHERLRAELLRRIERGTLTRAYLARLSGVSQPHISNFLNGKTRLSDALTDSILDALHLSVESFSRARVPDPPPDPGSTAFPLFQANELADADFASPRGSYPISLDSYRPSPSLAHRTARRRFVALLLEPAQIEPMHPVFLPGDIALVDRHATAPVRPESQTLQRGSVLPIYAVQLTRGETLFRHVIPERPRGLFLLQPGNGRFPAQSTPLVRAGSTDSPILGRVIGLLHPQTFQPL